MGPSSNILPETAMVKMETGIGHSPIADLVMTKTRTLHYYVGPGSNSILPSSFSLPASISSAQPTRKMVRLNDADRDRI